MADFKLLQNQYNLEHSHNFYELFVVLNGEFVEVINNQEFILQKGTVRFVKPEDKHYFRKVTDGVSVLRNMALNTSFFQNIFTNSGYVYNEALFKPFQISEGMLESYKEKTTILSETSSTEIQKRFIVKSIFENFIISRMNFKPKSSKIPLWLSSAYVDIEKDEQFLKGIKAFVALSTKSQEHFTREFKKYYNITPSEYINKLKLKKATELLTSTDKKILDIIFECGFDNVSYFNRVFKSKFGVTPSNFRDINRNIFNLN